CVTPHSSFGIFFIKVSSTCSTESFQRQNASRFATLSTCVSTAISGLSKATDVTTFAVFLPTPGNLINSSRSSGTTPSYHLLTSDIISGYSLPYFEINQYV